MMKREIIILITFFIVLFYNLSYSDPQTPYIQDYQDKPRFREHSFFMFKTTGFMSIGDTSVDIPALDGSKLSYRYGLQMLIGAKTETFSIGAGWEISAVHLFSRKSLIESKNFTYLNALVTCEISYSIFQFQFGFGPSFGVADTNGVEFAFMLGGGLNIPISSSVSMPLMVRSDWIYASQTSRTVSFMTGLSLYIGGTVKDDEKDIEKQRREREQLKREPLATEREPFFIPLSL